MSNEIAVTDHSEPQIEIRKAKEADLPNIISMFCSRMIDSVESSYMLDGISAKEELTELILASQIEDVFRIGEIWIAGDYQGGLTGHYGKDVTKLGLLNSAIKQYIQLNKCMTKADLKQLSTNLKRTKGAKNMSWRKKACGSANYFYIQLVAIDRSLKGSGTFRRLVEPILMRSECEKIPVLLDTHDKDNVPLYEHFGFELVKEHHAKSGAPVIQYSMIKRYVPK
jgi:predicted GNAT family N-acyltransferase